MTLGFVGGLSCGSFARARASAAVGAVVAGLAGAAIAFAAIPLFFRFLDPESGGLLLLFLTHGAIFAGIGATAGLALGLGVGDRSSLSRAAFGGLLGGLLGTFIFDSALSLMFPLMRTFQPIPDEPAPRWIAHLCVAIFVAFSAALAVGSPRGRQRTAPGV
jgi:hypothetical protein